jgi:hypothetical protein
MIVTRRPTRRQRLTGSRGDVEETSGAASHCRGAAGATPTLTTTSNVGWPGTSVAMRTTLLVRPPFALRGRASVTFGTVFPSSQAHPPSCLNEHYGAKHAQVLIKPGSMSSRLLYRQ